MPVINKPVVICLFIFNEATFEEMNIIAAMKKQGVKDIINTL